MPEAILQKSFVKYVRMEDEKDVDEFYEKKGIFWKNADANVWG